MMRIYAAIGAWAYRRIQDFETLCPYLNRRSLQRDFKNLLDKNLIKDSGVVSTQRATMFCQSYDKL
jgi:hypothetical protein